VNSYSNQIKPIIPKGCDNAPRKQIVIDFTVAVLTMQNEVIKEYADETIIWYQLKDDKKLEGLCSLISNLHEGDKSHIDFLEVHQVITHGKFASINGLISLANGSKIEFCDVYTFSNSAKSGKVKEVKSYRL
jgi:hypothetical protein